MKKYLFMAIVIFLSAYSLAYAAEQLTEVEVKSGNFSYNEGNDFPHPQPGPSGGFIQQFHPINDVYAYGPYFHAGLSGMTLEELYIFSDNVTTLITEHSTVGFIDENDNPVEILKSRPKDKKFLGKYCARSEPDQEVDTLVAMLMSEAIIKTNCDYVYVNAKFKNKPTAKGFSIGPGVAKDIGNASAASVGAILGWSSAENFMISMIEVEAYGGTKKVPAEETKPTIISEPISAKPKKTEPQEPTENVIKTGNASEANVVCDPIYSEFDKDIPEPGQDKKIDAMAVWCSNNWNTIRELEIRSYRDERGSLDYNGGLGIRTSKNIMFLLIDRLIVLLEDKNMKEELLKQCKDKFRATTASDLNPDYTDHPNNRRTVFILNGQPLTSDRRK